MAALKHGKKTKKRQKRAQLEMQKSRKKMKKSNKKQENFDVSHLHMIYDAQGFAEKLFKKVQKSGDSFDVRLLALNLISRLISVHQLLLLSFYPFLTRFLQPHQREVTKILLYTAQASHNLVPPDCLEEIVKAIANNFVTERNSGEVMAVGLNSIREIAARAPFALQNSDLLQDLTAYRDYKNKNVRVASQSLVQLFRTIDPSMLQRKLRGRPAEQNKDGKMQEFGESKAAKFVEGAEILASDDEDGDDVDDGKREYRVDGEDDSDEWIDMDSGDEVEFSESEEDSDQGEDTVSELTAEEKKSRAEHLSSTRLLTQKDFEAMKARKLTKNVKHLPNSVSDDASADIVSISDIERLAKRTKMTREERIAELKATKTKNQKKSHRRNPNASTTNQEKAKKKSFSMVRQKFKGKKKRSFREKQISLRDALLKNARFERKKG